MSSPWQYKREQVVTQHKDRVSETQCLCYMKCHNGVGCELVVQLYIKNGGENASENSTEATAEVYVHVC